MLLALTGRTFCYNIQLTLIFSVFFFFNDPPPTEFYPLPLPDALPICHEIGIALHALVVIGQAAIRVVLEMPAQSADAPVHARVLMNLVTRPTSAASVEQAHEPVG